MRTQTGVYYTLNETASRIWLGVIDGKVESDIVSTLLETYEGSTAEVTQDVRGQIEYLMAEDLLRNSENQPETREAQETEETQTKPEFNPDPGGVSHG